MIFDLFNEKTYKPLLIQDAFIVHWPEDVEEQLFVCHTSIITKELIYGNSETYESAEENAIINKRRNPKELRSLELI